MKITGLETFLTNSGLRNYLFLRLTTDAGITGLGEASLEWQEKTVETLLHEWVVDRILGADPFAVEELAAGMIRDQYQGGATVMTAISGVEIACWDLVGKALGKPLYDVLGGQRHDRLPSYANGWYGGARTPAEYAEKAAAAVKLGYTGLKFDPFGTAWKTLAPGEGTTPKLSWQPSAMPWGMPSTSWSSSMVVSTCRPPSRWAEGSRSTGPPGTRSQ